jgi:hypothetical protein
MAGLQITDDVEIIWNLALATQSKYHPRFLSGETEEKD